MSENFWCVGVESDRLDLEVEGRTFWIEVKRELNIGEQRKVETAGFKGMTGFNRTDDERGTEISIDWRAQSFARTEMYLIDWSLSDSNGNKLAITPERIRKLRRPVFEAIEKALNAHIEKRAEEKKAQAGVSEPSATSL